MTSRSLLALPLIALLAACSPHEAGQNVDEGSFGTPTMINTMAMMGEGQATNMLGERFNAEAPTTVTFAFNSDRLTPEAQATLATQARWIRNFPEVRFSVYGYADRVGSEGYNKGLGLRRAKAVVRFLASQGVETSRLKALVSYGETRPVVETQAPEERNRRAVTVVSGFAKNAAAARLNGKYAAIIMREYVDSATRPHAPNTDVQSEVSGN